MKLYRERVYRKNPDADEKRLAKIVAKCNWFVGSGQRIPVCIGHTPDNLQKCEDCKGTGKGEKDGKCARCNGMGAVDAAVDFLPIDVGSMDNFSTDGDSVFADLDLDEAFADAIKRHRGKSAELWSDDLLYPLSLLSYNRPALMLGPTKYQREGEHTTFTMNEDEEIDMPSISELKNLFAEVLNSSDLSAQVRTLTDQVAKVSLQCQTMDETHKKMAWLMEDEEEDEANENPAEAVAEDAQVEASEHPELPPQEVEQIAEDHVAEGNGEELNPGTPEVEEKNDMGAGMATPSGTNTFTSTVGTGTPKEEEKKPVKKNYEELALERETYRLAAENNQAIANTYAEQIAAAAAERERLTAENAQLVQKCSWERRYGRLLKESAVYQFDPDAEMKIAGPMTDEQFEQHMEVVKKYAKPPVNRPPVSVGELPTPKAPDAPADRIPKANVALVTKYALANKISPDAAWAKREEIWREAGVS